MRFQAPAAAVLCAVLVAIYLSFASSWPGTGIWMLGASLGLVFFGAALWAVGSARPAQREDPQRPQAASPFNPGAPRGQAAIPGMYGPQPSRRMAAREQATAGIHAAFIFIAAGLLGLMAFAGYAFTERSLTATGETAASGPERVAVERVDAELPAPAPEPATAERETDSPPPAPAVPADASPAQKAAAAAAAAAVKSSETGDEGSNADAEAGDGAEEADDSVAEATPVEMEDETEAAEEEAEPEPRRYAVKQGDTLYGIALGNDITVRLLLELNPSLSPSSLIHPGEVINLPPLESDDLLASSVSEDSQDGADDELLAEDEELLLEE